MDVKAQIIIIISIIVLLSGGCDQVIQSPENNGNTNDDFIIKDDNLTILKKIGHKTNEIISICEITNHYSTLAYKYKMANWKFEIEEQDQLELKKQIEESRIWEKKIKTLWLKYSNNWDQITDSTEKFHAIIYSSETPKDKLLEYINSENPLFVRLAVETLGLDLESDNNNLEEIFSYYDEGISGLSDRLDDNSSKELCENLGQLYALKAGYLYKTKKYEANVQAMQKAASVISLTKDARLISAYNQSYAASYRDIHPYQKDKVIKILKKAETGWASIENPTKKDEIDAYFEIEFLRSMIHYVEQGGLYYITRSK